MEFKSLKNIETGFRLIRFFGFAYLFVCASLVGFSLWKAYSFAAAQRQKIYVLDEGKSLMLVLSHDLEQNRPVEAREHVKRFHELFFTLAPDKSAIEGNVKRAMFLSDRSAYEHYSDLAEQGYYNRIISGNVSRRIEVDSISCNFNHYTYEVDFVTFKIVDKQVMKRTAIQEQVIFPLRAYDYATTVAGNKDERTVFVFDKFTIPADKVLVVEMHEKSGGRHQTFTVESEDIVRAKVINELKVK